MPMRDILSYFSAVTLQYISGHEWAIYWQIPGAWPLCRYTVLSQHRGCSGKWSMKILIRPTTHKQPASEGKSPGGLRPQVVGWRCPREPLSGEPSSLDGVQAAGTFQERTDTVVSIGPVCAPRDHGHWSVVRPMLCTLFWICFSHLGLRFLVRLCTDIGLKEVQEYATKLKRLEKMKEIREQVPHMGRKLLSVNFQNTSLL